MHLTRTSPFSLQRLRPSAKALVAAVLGLSAIGSADAHAYYSGLGFKVVEPIAKETTKGNPVPPLDRQEVCNVSGKTATRAVAWISGFRAADSTDKPADLYKASISSPSKPWLAGGCRTVTLVPISGVKSPGGGISATLTVTSSIGVARRTVTLTSPSSDLVPAEAAVDPVTFTAFRRPLGGDGKVKDQALLLRPAPDEKELSIPCQVTKPEPPAADPPKPCPYVGNVFLGQDVATVTVVGALRPQVNGPTRLAVALDDADRVGVYKGALDLANTPDDPDDDVKVEFTVGDPWCFALAALLLAVLIAVSGRMVASHYKVGQLRSQYRDLTGRYTTAIKRLNQSLEQELGQPARPPKWPTPANDSSAFEPLVESFDRSVDKLRKAVILVDAKGDLYKQIKEVLDVVDDDLQCIEDPARLSKSLDGLAKQLAALDTFLTEHGDQFDRAPAFAGAVGALLSPPAPLKVGSALKREADLKTTTAFVESWLAAAADLATYAGWHQEITEVSAGDAWSEEDQIALDRAWAKLQEARLELVEAKGAADFDKFTPTQDLQLSYQLLIRLSAEHRTPPLYASMSRAGAIRLTRSSLGPSNLLPTALASASGSQWLSNALDFPGKRLSAVGMYFHALMAALAVLAAGFVATYEQPWGTWRDYLTVFVVGGLGQAVVTAFIDALAELRPSPKTVLEGPAAELKALAKPAKADT